MKSFNLLGAACLLLMTSAQKTFSQANTKLSNLVAPTAVNVNLLPNTNNARDLGSNTKRWRNLLLSGKAGINVNPLYPLDIYNSTYSTGVNVLNPYTGEYIDRIGISSSSSISDNYGFGVVTDGGWYGVYATGNNGASGGITHGVFGGAYASSCVGTVIGVRGYAYGAYTNYGVYGSTDISCSGFNAAGFFEGDVYANNYFFTSDRKFKKNIASIENPLEQLMKLKPHSYEFKTDEYKNMVLPQGKQIGLIADEVKSVFPQLVNAAIKAAIYDKDRKLISKEEKYDAVNYMQLIPVLIASIQEQQKFIDAARAENQELKSRLSAIEQALNVNNNNKLSVTSSAITASEARLESAVPNPANNQAMISYYLPQNAGKAVINITNMNGTLMKSVSLTAQGKGQIVLDAAQFAAGTYNYSLMISGKLIDSKKLVFVR